MHDGEEGRREDQEPEKDWFARQAEMSERLGDLMRRLNNPDGSPMGELLAELNSVVDQVRGSSGPTQEEAARFRQARAEEKKNDNSSGSNSNMLSGLMGNLRSVIEEMQKPSSMDLYSAICEGDLQEARRLLDAGVSPNALATTGDSMLKLALVFERPEIVALLRDRGAVYGLKEAAVAGDTDRLTELLDTGVGASDPSSENALQLAASRGHIDAVRLLLARNTDQNAERRSKALATACLNGFPEIANLLVEAGVTVGIVEAAYLGDLSLLKHLLDSGADIETQNSAQITPLIAAASCGHSEVVRFLLGRGADLHARGQIGQTALGWAVVREHVPVIHLLIDHGVDPNASCSRIGLTPLGSAASYGKVRSVQALLVRGADPNRRGMGDRTPLHDCASSAARSTPSKHRALIDTAILLLNAGADIEARDSLHLTPLIVAAETGSADMVGLLLSRGADVRVSDAKGYSTPLSCARRGDILKGQRDKAEICTLIMEALGPEYAVFDAAERGDAERLTTLLDAGAPVDQGIVFNPHMLDNGLTEREDIEETPIMAAAKNGHVPIVRLLLGRSDVSASSKDSALAWAELEKQTEAARVLREAGAVNRWEWLGRGDRSWGV